MRWGHGEPDWMCCRLILFIHFDTAAPGNFIFPISIALFDGRYRLFCMSFSVCGILLDGPILSMQVPPRLVLAARCSVQSLIEARVVN